MNAFNGNISFSILSPLNVFALFLHNASLGFNLNLTYGLKPQVSSIKIVTVLQTIHFPS